ncbi:hypothetical protein [Robiginitomaculum antarcticum]|uniref:hypothetical protein n=1 Tax=Robiginitomaculum antarcticum TaxID=437507 RepID=UPI0003769A4E|nr:hypothetical protein [Robiginitomaculum antarcticum]
MPEFREKPTSYDNHLRGTKVRKKFATQMDEQLLEDIRAFAKKEGRQLQAVLEDAVEAYLKDQTTYRMADDVRTAYENTLRRFPKTLEILAK